MPEAFNLTTEIGHLTCRELTTCTSSTVTDILTILHIL